MGCARAAHNTLERELARATSLYATLVVRSFGSLLDPSHRLLLLFAEKSAMAMLSAAGWSLGEVAASVYVPTFEDFVYILSAVHSPLQGFLEFLLAVRQNRRT